MPSYSDAGYAGFIVFLVFFGLFFAAAGYLITSWFLMRLFEKAGVEGKWRAWVPVYNSMIFFKLGDLSPWLVLYAIGASILLGFIPVVNGLLPLAISVLGLVAAWRVGLKLQKEAVWLVLAFFLNIVWLGIVAFDRSRWNTVIPAAPWAGNGFLGDRTVWEGIPSQVPVGGYPANPATSPAPGYAPPPTAAYEPPAAPEPPVEPEAPTEPEAPRS